MGQTKTDENLKKEKAIQILNNKKANLQCSRCGNNSFSILDGYYNYTVQNKPEIHTFSTSGISA